MTGESENLDLTTTDDLLNALHRRFDSIVFMGCRERGEKSYETKLDWNGNHLNSIGMLRVLEKRMLKEFESLDRLPGD